MLDWGVQSVLVTGARGFLGRHVVSSLRGRGLGATQIAGVGRTDGDLTDARACRHLLETAFGARGPSLVIHCAGFVGGLGANRRHPARFFHDNLVMGLNLIEGMRGLGLINRGTGFVQVGTMCSYPAVAALPFKEESLFQGRPDPEIAPYGLAKLALLEMLAAYRSEHGLRSAYVIPVNLYGPGDNIADPELSHVAGALVRRFVEAADSGAQEVVCWGTGAPTRDFLYVEDGAAGVVRAAEVLCSPNPPAEAGVGVFPVNLASGKEVSIRALAELIGRLAGFVGRIVWDASKGDGVARRCLDVGRAERVLGWGPAIPLEEGLRRTIAWYRGTLSH